MVESGQNTAREPYEPTITPVRRPAAAAADRTGDGRRSGAWRLPLLGLAVLLAVAGILAVFVYLPAAVEEAEQAPPPVVEAPVEPEIAVPALSEAELAALTEQAESLLAELLEQREALAARAAASWGDTTWTAYETTGRLAADALLAGDPAESVAQHEAALVMGRNLLARSERLVADAIAAGFAALAGNDAALARSQFELALRIEPGNAAAQNGLARAASLPEVIAAMRRGDAHEQDGELQAAAAVYREVLAIDPEYAAARTALDSVNARIADARFASLITQGFAAIDARRFEEGAGHFAAALVLRPGSESARDGLAQAEQGLVQSEIRMAEVRATAFERTERWDEAIARYREALATDPTLAFAIEGLERAQQRADLDAKLTSLLDEPDTLLTDAGLRDGRLIFDEARAVAEPGPKLGEQIERLGQLIELATTPIPVTLRSDNETEVTVYRVGPLGRFASHELELKPGRYTAVGQRRGYRDVRETFTVLPGAENGPVTVVCAEPI